MLLRDDAFRRLCLARDMLAEVRDTQQSIREIALAARISPFHFIRQFEALFGLTPHQFRMERRMDQARRLLALGQHSVTDVCMEIGMSSLGSFSDLFTRRFGAAPSAFRRQARLLVQLPGVLPHEFFPGCLSMMGYLPPDAFRNFREATLLAVPLECKVVTQGDIDANQTHQHHGQRPGQGAEILY